MEQTPIVSIVIPVYNAEAHLRACLDSVKAQTFSQWQAILVDDGSKDGSGRICDEAAKEDPRFLVVHKENGGVSNARNDGMEKASGKYLMFIDADDLVTPEYLAEMVGAAVTYGTDLVLCGYDRFKEDWEDHFQLTRFYAVLFRSTQELVRLYGESKTNMFGVSIWAKLFRTDLIRAHGLRFDPTVSYEEDCLFITDCLPHIRTAIALGAPMYRYRQQDESLSKGYRRDTFRFLVNGYRRRCALLTRYGLSDLLPGAKSVFFLVIKNTCMKIANAGLKRAERVAEYGKLMAFPDVSEAVIFERKSQSGLTNRICAAIRANDPKRLDRVMRRWRILDAAVGCKNDLVRMIRNRGKKEEK